jgi:hypothetical protein
MSKCRVCRAPIRWGKLPGAKWIPLDSKPLDAGTFVFLDKDKIVELPWHSLEEVPTRILEQIPEAMIGWWEKVLARPHYRAHDPDCRQLAAMHISGAA